MFLSLILIAISLSADACAVSASYAVRKVGIPFSSKLIVCACSFIYALLSLWAGSIICVILPFPIPQMIGFVILFLMGIFTLVKGIRKTDEKSQFTEIKPKSIFNFAIRSLGITVSIVKNPVLCDFDNSRKIDAKEALFLSFALSVDSLGAGVGAAVSGLNTIWFPVLTCFCQFLFLIIGEIIGKKSAKIMPEKVLNILPGALLIAVSFLRLFYTI